MGDQDEHSNPQSSSACEPLGCEPEVRRDYLATYCNDRSLSLRVRQMRDVRDISKSLDTRKLLCSHVAS